MNVLDVDRISKRYRLGSKVKREIWALRDVSFGITPGTILGIIGPNGAGKTTLLKVIGRVTRPSSGRVTGYGRVVPLLALGAGFQPELSGRENIFLNAAMYGVPAPAVNERLDEIVEFAGLPDFLDVPVKRYSSGMYLRLAFSVAINMRPNILLADEVLAVGDLEFQERCLERVQRAGEAGMSVLFVSHDMEAIRRLCKRVLWLQAGEIAKVGPAEEVIDAYQNAVWSGGTRPIRGQSGASGPAGEILFARLTVDGREVGAARVSDAVTVSIGVRLAERGLIVRPHLDVKARGVLAFRSVTPDWFTVDEPGLYTLAATIPPHLLADTNYSADITIGIRRGEERLPLVFTNAISFQVYDQNEQESARGTFTGQFRGIVRPRLDWTVVRERA
ncbi:MAG: ABC transporter ATP-binding protein [Vicinamibacterales bacterium]